jgi:hypothetical protein
VHPERTPPVVARTVKRIAALQRLFSGLDSSYHKDFAGFLVQLHDNMNGIVYDEKVRALLRAALRVPAAI